MTNVDIQIVINMIDNLQEELRTSDSESRFTIVAAIGGLEMLRRKLYAMNNKVSDE